MKGWLDDFTSLIAGPFPLQGAAEKELTLQGGLGCPSAPLSNGLVGFMESDRGAVGWRAGRCQWSSQERSSRWAQIYFDKQQPYVHLQYNQRSDSQHGLHSNSEATSMFELSENLEDPHGAGGDSSDSTLGSSVTACKKVLCSSSLLESTEYWLRNEGALCRIGFMEDKTDHSCTTGLPPAVEEQGPSRLHRSESALPLVKNRVGLGKNGKSLFHCT
ncbi:UNVERIFIED_CONTAM: hypothetical protein FKN15_044682 [Acipenser sinensis]